MYIIMLTAFRHRHYNWQPLIVSYIQGIGGLTSLPARISAFLAPTQGYCMAFVNIHA